MVSSEDLREFLYTVILIAAFSITGFFVYADKTPSSATMASYIEESPHGVGLVANPVVRIQLPEHNIFAP